MSAFDQLHPALQHHIVNSLGWRDLRPFQENCIPRVLAGEHVLVLAPTAGGKTEAAFFPVLSRMLTQGWKGLSVLYLCPLKALLNNLEQRLSRYCSLVGRRCALWHGDVGEAGRRGVREDPPDCLLTTPESLEVMLVSRKVDRRRLFSDLQVVIVDEIHAFAGDDRGWHLLSVLERVARLSQREPQRIGLSATVGNPKDLVEWLAGGCSGPRAVLLPLETDGVEPEVQLDFVGTLENAAEVISRLHRGEKRLVFVDSRARAEELSSRLRELEVRAFVTHSSLSRDERHRAEEAFSTQDDCVIVATSVLELGVDVGDLDRVIQIDAPGTVSQFLQRMGRTGRRGGTRRNCLFLATSDEALLQAAALIDLWEHGFVEPVVPPASPLHVFAQQVMALALQEGGIARSAWRDWVGRMPAFASMGDDEAAGLIDYMVRQEILWDESGILWFGRKGESEFGHRHFMDLLSVITSEPLFSVRYGRADLGSVHALSFGPQGDGPSILLLGGRSWQVAHLDWGRKVAHVEPSPDRGRSRWRGDARPLSYELCQAIKTILAEREPGTGWSRRARERMDGIRGELHWVSAGGTVILSAADTIQWWTFAGAKANSSLATAITARLGGMAQGNNLSITLEPHTGASELEACVGALRGQDAAAMLPTVNDKAIEGLKFSVCLPLERARHILETRASDPGAVRRVLDEVLRVVVQGE